MTKYKADMSPIPVAEIKIDSEETEITAPSVEIEASAIAVRSTEETVDVAPVISPYKLRAVQDTTFMQFDENKKLLYSDNYKRGQEVSNPQKVNDILASQQHNHFRKVKLGAD